MASRNILLLSNSIVHGSGYLEWAATYIKEFLSSHHSEICHHKLTSTHAIHSKAVTKVLFIPYALQQMDDYADNVAKKFTAWGFELSSVHRAADPVAAVRAAEAIFVGGGNTFQLLNALYQHSLVEAIRERVLKEGVPYVGSSAGSNVATVSINTTNDMPIVYPPSFAALALLPFNINPHYIDADPATKHMGETREERISQYHQLADTPPVLGLREGSLLRVHGDAATLLGLHPARLFRRGKQPEEFPVGTDFSFLLK